MNNRPQLAGTSNHGFTLLEILLVLVLLLLLFGAAVIGFNSMGRGVSLSEGANQLESLFRFARSESERTSRKIRIRFSKKNAAQSSKMNLASHDGKDAPIQLASSPSHGGPVAEWEPNPFDQPGLFTQLPHSVHFTESLDNLVIVESVKQTDLDSRLAAQLSGNTTLQDSDSAAYFEPDEPTAIYFYPDGSSDSVKVRLAARNPDNPNKATVELIGLTGTMRREIIEITPDQPISAESSEGAQAAQPPGPPPTKS